MIPRVLFFDIETTDLDADFGNMLAFGYRWQGVSKTTTVLSLLDFAPICRSCGRVDAVSDAKLVAAAREVLNAADMWVTWYGKLFDARFVNTRVVDSGLPPLFPVPHVDLYWTAKTHLKLSSNRLASVQDFLQLPSKKTVVSKRVWRQAQAGHVESLQYIIRHCKLDVNVLEEAYQVLRPYVRQHPRLYDLGACRVCGARTLQRNGTRASLAKGPQIRIRCLSCGHNEQRAMTKAEAHDV